MAAIERRGLLVLACVLPAFALACGGVPVVIGKDGPDFDACLGVGVIVRETELYPTPQDRPEFQQSLAPGTQVFVCDGSEDGAWSGVVLPDGDESCGVTSPVESPRPYGGPCRSGWVKSLDIEVVAG